MLEIVHTRFIQGASVSWHTLTMYCVHLQSLIASRPFTATAEQLASTHQACIDMRARDVLQAILFCACLASNVVILLQAHDVDRFSTWHGLAHTIELSRPVPIELPPAPLWHSSLYTHDRLPPAEIHPVACLTAQSESQSSTTQLCCTVCV